MALAVTPNPVAMEALDSTKGLWLFFFYNLRVRHSAVSYLQQAFLLCICEVVQFTAPIGLQVKVARGHLALS